MTTTPGHDGATEPKPRYAVSYRRESWVMWTMHAGGTLYGLRTAREIVEGYRGRQVEARILDEQGEPVEVEDSP